MGTYRVLLPIPVSTPDGGPYNQGDVFDHVFDSPEDEQTNLESGLLEIVPRTYKVIGPSRVYETDPDGEFEMALTMAQEAHLIDGGFIARVVEPEPEPKKPTRKKKEE